MSGSFHRKVVFLWVLLKNLLKDVAAGWNGCLGQRINENLLAYEFKNPSWCKRHSSTLSSSELAGWNYVCPSVYFSSSFPFRRREGKSHATDKINNKVFDLWYRDAGSWKFTLCSLNQLWTHKRFGKWPRSVMESWNIQKQQEIIDSKYLFLQSFLSLAFILT